MSRFELGRVTGTPGAIELLGRTQRSPMQLLLRHANGDWGELDDEDRKANEAALVHGSRLLSAYGTGDDKVWIITDGTTDACPACQAGIGVCEPDKGEWQGGIHFRTDQPQRRLSTTVLRPDEY